MGREEEKEGVDVGAKRKTLWDDSIPHSKGKQNCMEEIQMNDAQTSSVTEAETTCCPVKVRTSRHHCKTGEEPPLPSSCETVSSLQPARNQQLEAYCRADLVIM